MSVESCVDLKKAIRLAYDNSGGLSMGEGFAYCKKCGIGVRVVNNLEGVPSETTTSGKIEEKCISYTNSKE